MKNFRGSEIYPLAMCVTAELGDGSYHRSWQRAARHDDGVAWATDWPRGQRRNKRSWFKPDPPPVPRSVGAYGTARLASNDDLRACGLTGGAWGHGLRLGEDTRRKYSCAIRAKWNFSDRATRWREKTTCATRMLAKGKTRPSWCVDPKGEFLAINRRRRASIGPRAHIAPVKDRLPEGLHHFVDSSDSYNPLYGLNPKS